MDYQYDVIVIGGRVAGANLAARLGNLGMRVLIVERNEMPSLPAVSSPIIYAPTMAMLDEIGADEAEYARNTPRIYAMSTINQALSGKWRIPMMQGRDYAYAIDRARFDYEVYQAALRQPNVSGRTQYNVLDVLRDENGAVCGILGKSKDSPAEEITARVVVGADGRFSLVARKVQAQEFDRHDANPTSIYYAYWHNVAPLDDDGASAIAYEADGTFGYLVMDSADGQTVVCMEGRADTLDPQHGNVEGFYLEMLQRNPHLWQRLAHAEKVTSVRGMRHIGNLYRQAGGAGWALVGDAFHQKDPLDGQGIHDAVYMGKILALSMKRWWEGKISWETALSAYDEVIRTKTYPLYKTLQGRVQNSFYSSISLPIPSWVVGKIGEWVAQDTQINQLFGQMLTRQIPPDMVTLFTVPLALNAIAKGSLREAQSEVKKRLQAIF